MENLILKKRPALPGVKRMLLSGFVAVILTIRTFSMLLIAHTTVGGLAEYDLWKSAAKQVLLPKQLREVSGLAVTDDGRVFAHNDEQGTLFQIDPRTGSVVKRFSIGIQDDFEGIAVAGSTFYLVNSRGTIYAFSEGKENEKVPFKTYATALTAQYDVEGLCYDPLSGGLLLACKGYAGLKNIGSKAIFSFSLKTGKLSKDPIYLLSLKELEQKLGKRSFHPSAIEFNPSAKTFFVLDSEIRSIAEINTEGKILAAVPLDRSLHKQPEGIAFGAKGELIIADEGSTHGTLTIYPKTK